MAAFTIVQETETGRGWRYDVRLDAGATLDVSLRWADCDLWGRGSVPPVRVVEALLLVLIDRGALEDLGPKFDASTARRLVRTLDEDVPEQLTHF